MNRDSRHLRNDWAMPAPAMQPFEEQHYPVSYWASRWGFSAKAVRDWLRDEYGPGILRLPHTGRRNKAGLHHDHGLRECSGTGVCQAHRTGTGQLICLVLR